MTDKPPRARHGTKAEKLFPLADVTADLGMGLDREYLLQLVMDNATRLLGADRSTLFLVDRERQELWSKIAQGIRCNEIRVPITEGIVGYVANTGETLNVPDAYKDPRFNPSIDRQTGYLTKSLLCMPLLDPHGKIVGVIQVLNKQSGTFTQDDERALAALCSQAAILIGILTLYGT